MKTTILGIHWFVWLLFIFGAVWIFWPKNSTHALLHEEHEDQSQPNRLFRLYALSVNVGTILLVSFLTWWITKKIEAYAENFITYSIRQFKADAGQVNLWDGIPWVLCVLTTTFTAYWVFQFGRGIIVCGILQMIVTNDSLISHREAYGGEAGGWGLNPWWAKMFKPPISLEGETKSHTPKGGCTTRDGLWEVTFGFVISPQKERIFHYIERGAQEVEEEFKGIITGLVAGILAGKSNMDLLNQVEDIRRQIEGYFDEGHARDPRIVDFEESYGADVDSFRIEVLRPAERTQHSLEDSFEADRIGDMISQLRRPVEEGGAGLDSDQAAKIARMFGSEGDKATEQIFSIDMSPETAKALGGVLVSLGNNPAATGALISKITGGKGGRKPKTKDHGGGH